MLRVVARADLGAGVMTTNPERKKRSVEPAVTVERLVRAQLRAMGCARFDLGVRRDGGEMVLREGQGAFAVAEAVKWLRHENAKGAHVYIRPAGVHSLSLLDDLTAEAIERMKAEGFEPAVVVETSPHNFQVWLNHGEILSAATKHGSRRSSSPSASQAIHRARTGAISDDWRASPIRSPSGNWHPGCGRSRVFGQRKAASIPSAAEFLAGIVKNDRVRNRAGQGTAPAATPTHRRRGR